MDTQLSKQSLPESSVFSTDPVFDQYEREQYQHGIRKARNVLFFVGALLFTVDMVVLFFKREQIDQGAMYVVVGIDLVILATFIGLGLYTKRKPYGAILAGIIFFCLIQIGSMILDPTTIGSGWLLKIAVIASLVTGLKKARALRDMDRFTSGNFD